ncbi:MAG: glycosyltransferase [Acidobacteria bacterium]|nr:glycosyltransferase [Acidobacteriota bacterium]
MVDRLKDRFDFWIVTRDHDGDNIQYKGVKINGWNNVRGARVFYLSKNNVKISKLRELIIETKPDSVYLNSVFSPLSIFVLMLRRLSLIPKLNIILAPEGEISDGALKIKPKKKKVFLKLAKNLGLHENLIWKTASDFEKYESERIKGSGGEVFVAPNLPSRMFLEDYNQRLKPQKNIGEAKMVFLSRFMRKKNFNWLLDLLDKINGNLQIDIFGNLEDKDYWAEARQIIKNLPENIKIEYKGLLPYEEVLNKLFEYHFFILPTLSENFGHVFIEALAAGCPLIISDRTPWLNLEEKRIGWDLSLEKPNQWVNLINYCLSIDNKTYSEFSSNARKFAIDWLSDINVEENTLRVLEYSLDISSKPIS